MTDPTSTSTLQQLVPYLLPERGQEGSILTAPTDLAAVLVHAIHTSLEFRLVRPAPSSSTNQSAEHQEEDEQQQQGRPDDNEDTFSETETAVNADEDDDEQAGRPSASSSSLDTRFVRLATEARLPAGWNDRGEDSYTFTYKHEQSGLSFIVRVGRMGARINVSGMAEDGEPRQTSTILSELVDPAFLPWPRSDEPASRANHGVQAGFVSESKLREFVERYKREVIAKLIPGLRIAGYTEPSGSDDRPPTSSNPRSNPYNNHRPDPSSGSRNNDRDYNPYNPSVGHRDLDPTAAFQPPGMGGRLGPFGGPGPGGDGGGMLVDFDHPMFRGRRDDGREQGPGGMMNPPGARWDPVGPGFPGGPDGGNRGQGGLGGGYGGIRGGRTPGEPDFDELLPPGENGPDLRQPGGRGGLGGPLGGGFGGGFGGGGMGGGLGGGGFGGRGGGGGGFGGGGGGMFM